MGEQKVTNQQPVLFAVYPALRRAVYEAFDRQSTKITRTQQIILITMSDMATLNMSELARKIDTSNEQATRAVTQLVNMGFIDRSQNENNHRIVNIRLTEKAGELLAEINAAAEENLTAQVGKDGFAKVEEHLEAIGKEFSE